MKQIKSITFVTALAFSCFAVCASEEVPSNSLQVEYKNHTEQSSSILSLNTVYNIPTVTYEYLDEVFTSFYNTITFNTDITDSTFKKSAQNELIAIPLILDNNQGVNFELFGNFSDPSTQKLSNVSSDQLLYNYMSSTEALDIYSSTMSLGAGFSFPAGENTKIKIILSNNEMPGYGNSNALVGFETSF
jgi:hypothetical protein